MRALSVTQPIMEKLFPRLDTYPMNSLTPSLGEKEGKPLVSLLILADDFMIDDFRRDETDDIPIELSTFTERNPNGMGLDFGMKLDFYFKTGHPVFTAIVSADELDKQAELLIALKKVNELYIWIANNDRMVERFIIVPFDYNVNKNAIDAILNKKGFQ